MSVHNGVMVVSSEVMKGFYWIDAKTGAQTAKVDLSTVGLPRGIALDNSGRALVIVNDQVLAFTKGSATPAVLIDSGAFDGAYRIAVNHANGDIYVAEGGLRYKDTSVFLGNQSLFDNCGDQVKRFSAQGQLLQTYGKKGGRKYNGAYDPQSGFVRITELSVAADGSFWITEGGAWADNTMPRRIAHYAKSGTHLKDLYGGYPYAAPGCADPEDPSIVWLSLPDNTQKGVVRAKVDYVDKTWKPLGCYVLQMPPLSYGDDFVIPYKRNGKTYLFTSHSAYSYYFDEQRDTLIQLGFQSNTWPIYNGWTDNPYGGNKSDPAIRDILSKLWVLNRSNRGLVSWCDLNLDGKFPIEEWTGSGSRPALDLWTNEGQYRLGPNWELILVKEDPTYVGITCAPVWHTVNGIDVPQYVISDSRFISHYVDSVVAKGGKPDPRSVYPGRTLPTTGMGDKGTAIDEQGNIMILRHGTWSPSAPEATKIARGQNILAKFDKNGTCVWSVKCPYARWGATPANGQISFNNEWGDSGTSLYKSIGSVYGCFVGVDIRSQTNYVWNEDGLWVGNLLENTDPSQASLPSYTWKPCGEQFNGTIYRVPNDNTPGLRRGEVLFFAAGQNDVPVYRIHGFDQFVRISTTITVQGGKIISQGPVSLLTDVSRGPNALKRQAASAGSVTVTKAGTKTLFSVALARRAAVTIELFGIDGRLNRSVVKNSDLAAGTHTFVLGAQPTALLHTVARVTVDGLSRTVPLLTSAR